jgi:hypothetical protein
MILRLHHFTVAAIDWLEAVQMKMLPRHCKANQKHIRDIIRLFFMRRSAMINADPQF